jgi:transposase
MARMYCGLDAGSSVCHIAVQAEDGTLVERREFQTSEANLIEVFERIRGELHVHVEASELAGWVHGILRPRVARLVTSHPPENKWISGDSQKSDPRDALKLADLIRRNAPVKEVYYSDSEPRRAFKMIVQHYDDLTDQESRIKFKIKAVYRQQGIRVTGDTVYAPAGRSAYLARVSMEAVRTVLQHLYQVLDQTLRTRDQAKAQMGEAAKLFPEIERLDKVPGVGFVGACQFSAYIQNPNRFSTKRKLWRYCRLAVSHRSSDGHSLGHPRIDRSGVGRLKAMSRSAFLGAMRRKDDNLFKRCFRQSWEKSQNQDHARLTTQRKIVSVLRALWRDGTDYNDDIEKG